MTARDRQRRRVYAWEDRFAAPHGATPIPFAGAQGMVDAIWREMGLQWPPSVEPLPAQARRLQADANRLTLRLPRETPSFVLLHELAHALSATHEGQSDGHGPVFLGLYVQLLTRYLRLDETMLLASLKEAGLQVEPKAKPVFL